MSTNDYHFEVLDPLPDGVCQNPKCFYPSIPHIDCGESFIITKGRGADNPSTPIEGVANNTARSDSTPKLNT